MSEARRVAVILVRHDAGVTPPTLDECRAVMLTGQESVARYWRENTEGWFEFPLFDFFGPYDIALPPPPDSRRTVLARARAAAQGAGVNLAAYDATVVFNCPGTGYDAGATGIGPSSAAILGVADNHTFFSHEFGHVLGFDHSYGIPTTGADWSNDGVDQLYPVYGDPYDIMSSATFGGADPTRTLSAPFSGFPNAAGAGPMLARAQLHFARPAALELTRKVRHVYEDGDSAVVTLHPAGNGVDGEAELVVFHPSGEDGQGRGRVYVEYRQPFDFSYVSLWDSGLADSGDARDRRGVIVHVVQDVPGTTTPAVWYAGRICFPSPDTDVQVGTPRGPAVVSVSDEFARQSPPAYVRVRISREARPRVSLAVESEESARVIGSERRPIPGWEWAGEFTWERRETTRKVTYTPATAGLGGSSPHDAATSVTVNWYVNGSMLTADSGVETLLPPGRESTARLIYAIDPATRALTLANEPADGSFAIAVQASASDPSSWANPLTADSSYEVDGLSEGWGADYQAFMDFWDRITNPIPIPDYRPPRPDDYRIERERLGRVYERLRVANPSVAERLQPLVVDQLRVLRRLQYNR